MLYHNNVPDHVAGWENNDGHFPSGYPIHPERTTPVPSAPPTDLEDDDHSVDASPCLFRSLPREEVRRRTRKGIMNALRRQTLNF